MQDRQLTKVQSQTTEAKKNLIHVARHLSAAKAILDRTAKIVRARREGRYVIC